MIAPEIFHDGRIHLYGGDSREVLKSIPDNSIDACVTDPPYGISFMGRKWDVDSAEQAAFAEQFWREVYRVLKPGGHVLAFSATRTVHRLTCAIEDAGFEIRDMVAWMYGSGFPKSHDVARAIDAMDALAPRRERALQFTAWMRGTGITAATIKRLTASNMASHYLTVGAQPEVATAEMFDLLRPALPPVPAEIEELVRARTVESENLKRRRVIGHHEDQAHAAKWREAYDGSEAAKAKPITEAYTETARKWQGWGTALKPSLEPITMARKPLTGTVAENVVAHGTGALNVQGCRIGEGEERQTTTGGMGLKGSPVLGAFARADVAVVTTTEGRWPANIVHDGSDEVVAAFPETGGSAARVGRRSGKSEGCLGEFAGQANVAMGYDDAGGSAARFFYSAKADADDRIGSKHPTVKPVDLMQWCIRLVTPPGGTVLDPFAGSGTTGEAAFREGMRAVLIEREPEYRVDIARRMTLALAGPAIRRAERAKARGRTAAPAPLFGED